MTDEQYIRTIQNMTLEQLLDEVIANPDYLTDSYYFKFGRAIRKRYAELKG